MASEVIILPSELMMPNDAVYEECSQLVTYIRSQRGDPNELINQFLFKYGQVFGLVERERTMCDNETDFYTHTANFALVLKESFLAGEVSEMKLPIFSFDRCTRRWQVVANFIRGNEVIEDEININLQCLDVKNGPFIRADISTDLYRGTERIEDRTLNVYFGSIVSKYVIVTGARYRTPADDTVAKEGFADAYTILGSLCLKLCCDDKYSSSEEAFASDFELSV